MAVHTVKPIAGNLVGSFSKDFPPILTIEPGDTVIYRTLDAGWGLEPQHPDGSPRQRFSPREKERDDGHCLCGPIAIHGAQPGMTLEIHIRDIQPGSYGWTHAEVWDSEHHKHLDVVGQEATHLWTLDAQAMTGRNQHGLTIPLRPFMGVLSVAPAEPGIHSTVPPRPCGGNMDCKELVAGTTLYLPVQVAGALFSVGDGHARQGDGEVSVTAVECPMDRVELTFNVRDDMTITTPWANTPAGWLVLGFHENLDYAVGPALEGMIDLMCSQYNLARADAIVLASLLVDLRITQIVNGVRGVHAVLPHRALG